MVKFVARFVGGVADGLSVEDDISTQFGPITITTGRDKFGWPAFYNVKGMRYFLVTSDEGTMNRNVWTRDYKQQPQLDDLEPFQINHLVKTA